MERTPEGQMSISNSMSVTRTWLCSAHYISL